ncbi:tape measure protein [Georgenia wangjunii]|uniref:tape measure protein n=1 Tax=Georgenia wangjunii TaxID=3117730 RepID=UPI002F26A929
MALPIVGGAAVEVRPVFPGFNQSMTKGLTQAMSGAGGQAGSSFAGAAERSMGSRLGGAFKSVAKVGVATIAGIGTAVAGIAIKGGIDRALNIEDAQAKLRGLGHDAASVTTIMESALGAVRGTAYGLDSAATAAAGAVAAGIKPGQELTKYLSLTADAATIAGTSMDEMGSIMNRVQTSGSAFTEDLNMLADRGIPIFQWLADEYGVTATELRKMVSDGKVDAETYRKVIEENIGGAALASGDTTRGAFKNMGAALSRAGVTASSVFMPHMKSAFGEATVLIDGINERLGPVMEDFTEWFGPRAAAALDGFGQRSLDTIDRVGPKIVGFFTNARAGAQGLYDLVANGNYSSALRDAFGWEEDSPVVDRILDIRDAAQGLYDLVANGNYSGALRRAFGWEEDDPMVDRILDIRDAVGQFFDDLRSGDTESLGGSFRSIGESIGVLAPVIVDAKQALPGFTDAVRVGASVLGWMADHVDLVAKAIPFVLVGFAAWKTMQLANNLVGRQSVVGLGFEVSSRFALAAAIRAQTAATVSSTAATGTSTAAQAGSNAAVNAGFFARTRATIALGAHRVATVASTAASKAMAAGQWLVNAAMTANPIGLVVAALGLLVAAFVTAYKKSETFRNIVDGALQGVKTAASTVWNWLRDNVFAKFGTALAAIGTGAVDAKNTFMRGFNDMRNAARSPINWVIREVYTGGIKGVFDRVAGALGISTRLPVVNEIPAFARGGHARPGWALVGEEGPELVNFDRPGRVYTAAQTKAMQQGWSEQNPPHGASVWDNLGNAWSATWRGAADWVRGGLADAAGAVLTPLRSLVTSSLGGRGAMGDIASGTATSAIDKLVSWIRGKDEEAQTDPQGRSLRGARPHVNAGAFRIADAVGGIRTMQAFNQSMAGGHPKGLAVDFIDAIGKLNRVSGYIVDQGSRLGTDYMAWQGQLWSPGRGWRPQGRGFGNDPYHRWHLHWEALAGAKTAGGRAAAQVYDRGGDLLPGGIGVNLSRKPESVLTNQVTRDIHRLAAGRARGGSEYVQLVDERGDVMARLRKVSRDEVTAALPSRLDVRARRGAGG